MPWNRYKKEMKGILTFILACFTLVAQGQRPTAAAVYSQMKKAESRIDSLSELNAQLTDQLTRAHQTISQQTARLTDRDSTIDAMQSENDALNTRLSQFKEHNLKLDQSNRILIVFNSIVGFLLLITLVWFVRNLGKKKSSVMPETKNTADKGSNAVNSLRNIESKLEQLERLNRLREKNILTEGEFENEKRQILG